MITSRFPLGDVSFSAEYFSTLVGEATKQCYGVAAMTPRDLTDVVKSVVCAATITLKRAFVSHRKRAVS